MAPGRADPETIAGWRLALDIGVLAGIALGVFLGAWSAPLQVIGHAYVGLLQMTVLPVPRHPWDSFATIFLRR